MKITFTDLELEALLADIESDVAERKASFSGDVATRARRHMAQNGNPPPEFRVSASSVVCVLRKA